MPYKIIWLTYCCIQPILIDFLSAPTLEVIDCRNLKGKHRYIELYGARKFNQLNHRYNHEAPEVSYFGELFLSKSLLQSLFANLHERSKRLVAAFLILSVSTKNKAILAKFMGIDLKTIQKGIHELQFGKVLPPTRIRRSGGGRKSKDQEYPNFSRILEALTEDHLAGDPMNTKRWVRKSLQYFQDRLDLEGIRASLPTIRSYLRKSKIFLKKNIKSLNTQCHKNRDRQFRRVNCFKNAFLRAGKPVISIDTKKKEQIGLFEAKGKLWRKVAKQVLDHDFPSLGKGKAIPFGIYDLKYNRGYMYCGTSHETSQFLVEMIVKWWTEIGQFLYPNQTNLLILCDAGGANGYNRRGWKWELSTQLATTFGLKVTICHYPPGASKWNPIEHKLFSFISINWAGEPLTSYRKMLNFINTTVTKTGLTVTGVLNIKKYETGIDYSNAQMAEIKLKGMKILPNWNYRIFPN
jgi:hypothetical protein